MFNSVVVAVALTLTTQPPPQIQRVSLSAYLQMGYAGMKADLTEAAEAMPDADYGFKPTSMSEVRSFGRTIAHVAAGHFGTCARLRGVPNPYASEKLEQRASSKADVLKLLSESFAFCDSAVSSLTDENVSEFVKQARAEIPRSAAIFGLIAHDAEMYGITTVYLRAKNIVPPSTARQQPKRP